jgi:hypothetical protein
MSVIGLQHRSRRRYAAPVSVRLLIIGDPPAIERAAARARELGAQVVGASGDPQAIVGVGCDDAVRQAAQLAADGSLAHPHPPTGAIAGTDIGVARARLAEAGIAQPPWRECASADEVVAAARELGWPILVRSLGEDVRVTAATADEAREAAERAIGASHRQACVVELKRPGGCSRERRADVDAALGCTAEVKLVGGEVVAVRALAAMASPEQAVDDALAYAGSAEAGSPAGSTS